MHLEECVCRLSISSFLHSSVRAKIFAQCVSAIRAVSAFDVRGLLLATSQLPAASHVGLLPYFNVVQHVVYCSSTLSRSSHIAPGLIEVAMLPMLISCLNSSKCVITLYLSLLSDKPSGPQHKPIGTSLHMSWCRCTCIGPQHNTVRTSIQHEFRWT